MKIAFSSSLLILMLFAGCHSGKQKTYSRAAIYVAAHQDDWQLFMGRDFYNDACDTNQKIVLLLTTSGCGKKDNYCQAREEGVLASVKYVTDAQATVGSVDSGYQQISGFKIPYYRINNVTVLMLRLPDGNTKGEGFAEFGNNSLVKLQRGETKNIYSTDSVNWFADWQNLTLAVKTITDFALGSNQKNVTLHLPDTSTVVNPNDHPDHLASAFLALDAYSGKNYKTYFYSQYQNEFLPDNLQGIDSVRQKGLFDAYDNAVTRKMGYCTTCYTDLYSKWCRRIYRREPAQ